MDLEGTRLSDQRQLALPELKLGDVLVAAGVITQIELLEALEVQRTEGRKRRLGEILVQLGILSETQVSRGLSGRLRLGYVELDGMAISNDVVHLIPRSLAERHEMIPIDLTADGVVLLAMADPTNIEARDDVRALTRRNVKGVCARPSDVRAAIDKHYRFEPPSQRAARDATPSKELIDAITQTMRAQIGDEAARAEAPSKAEDMAVSLLFPDDQGWVGADVVDMVDVIFADAFRLGASDIHVEPQAQRVVVRFRIDGMLREALTLPKPVQAPLLSRIKVLAALDIADRRRPQDGRITIQVRGGTVDTRVSTMPTLHGEKIVVRLLDPLRALLGLDQLGMAERDQETVKTAVERSQGFVLVCGPTGSGKTSTLYALLQSIHKPEANLVTIEDPVEYQIAGVSQVQVDERTGVTFSRALRTVLRQDPDIVMVGEIRDRETAEIAFQAALTGHLVLSTIHTNDAPSAITRLVDMGVEPFLVASAVSLVVAQRLVRRVCPSCSAPAAEVPEKVLSALAIPASKVNTLKRGRGCRECRQSGYSGRIGVFEVLPVDDRVRVQIMNQASEAQIAETAGLRRLATTGVDLALSGVTTAEEVVRVLQSFARPRSVCATCGAETMPGYLACPYCKAELTAGDCHACGCRLLPEWRVCPLCATPVGVPPNGQAALDDEASRAAAESPGQRSDVTLRWYPFPFEEPA